MNSRRERKQSDAILASGCCLLLALLPVGLSAAPSAPLRIADQRELFVDDAVLERMESVEVWLAPPTISAR
jgi:hypothetical protein